MSDATVVDESERRSELPTLASWAYQSTLVVMSRFTVPRYPRSFARSWYREIGATYCRYCPSIRTNNPVGFGLGVIEINSIDANSSQALRE